MAVARGLVTVALLSLACSSCKRTGTEGQRDDPARSGERASASASASASARPDPRAGTPGATEKSGDLPADGIAITWLHDERAAQRQARATGRPLLIDFSAEWCAPCQKMDETTFRDPELASTIAAEFVALKVDVTAMTEDDKSILARYQVQQLPVILITSEAGDELHRWSDFVEAGPMREALSRLSSRK